MSLESLIEDSGQLASILAEAADGQVPPQTAMGGADRSDGNWLTVADGVPVLVRTRSSALNRDYDDERAQVIDATLYFAADPVPSGSGLSSRHRIVVADGGTGGGRAAGVYAVLGVIDPNSMGRILQVDCERIRVP